MALYHCELFGHFIYSLELSYNELLEREAVLLEALDDVLRGMDAAHIEFTPMGDALRVQCQLGKPNEELFHSAAEAIAPLLGQDVEGRLLFVDKDMTALSLYYMAHDSWKEARIELPTAAESVKRAESDPTPSADLTTA